MNILICSQLEELQVMEVCQLLHTQGVNPVMFERYRKDQFISYQYSTKQVTAILRIKNVEYSLDSKTFPIIWYRPKPTILGEIPGEIAKIEEKFCAQEWRTILQSLDIFLAKSKWVNNIHSSQIASNKAFQLKVAREIGLTIPSTVITNDATQALKLFQDNRVIYKTLNSFFSAKDAIYTNEILYNQVIENKDAITMAPGIFQKYVDKKYELRITIIGDKLFVARINSQQLEESSIDWRRKPNSDLYEFSDISYDTKKKLLGLHRALNLVYASYDFIVDLEGNEIFIECNPSGQWLWVENNLNLNISQMMANELLLHLH